jgi:hypothetical protein
MRTQLVAENVGLVCEHFQSTEPLAADIIVSFLKRKPGSVHSVVEIRKMEKAAHVKCLPDRPQFLHQCMVEAGEMFVLQRLHDGRGKRDRAGFDRVARELATLDENFRKDCERVFEELATGLFEMRLHECIVNLMQRARELLAVATSPIFAADKATNLPPREMDCVANRLSIVGMLLDQCNKNFVRERSRLSELRIGTDCDVLLDYSAIEFDLFGSCSCDLLVVTEQRACDPLSIGAQFCPTIGVQF